MDSALGTKLGTFKTFWTENEGALLGVADVKLGELNGVQEETGGQLCEVEGER